MTLELSFDDLELTGSSPLGHCALDFPPGTGSLYSEQVPPPCSPALFEFGDDNTDLASLPLPFPNDELDFAFTAHKQSALFDSSSPLLSLDVDDGLTSSDPESKHSTSSEPSVVSQPRTSDDRIKRLQLKRKRNNHTYRNSIAEKVNQLRELVGTSASTPQAEVLTRTIQCLKRKRQLYEQLKSVSQRKSLRTQVSLSVGLDNLSAPLIIVKTRCSCSSFSLLKINSVALSMFGYSSSKQLASIPPEKLTHPSEKERMQRLQDHRHHTPDAVLSCMELRPHASGTWMPIMATVFTIKRCSSSELMVGLMYHPGVKTLEEVPSLHYRTLAASIGRMTEV